MDTLKQYEQVIQKCYKIFENKFKDYGSSFRAFRTISIVDQLFIKIKRIHTIQEAQEQWVDDSVQDDFMGIVNYSIIGLIQIDLGNPTIEELEPIKAKELYDRAVKKAKDIFVKKNHDYGEAWRSMSQESFIDLMLVKITRLKQILKQDKTTTQKELLSDNFIDILNYAIFALLQMDTITKP
ncbi:MAG: DUF1599 domain-containing protein [Phycisphaerales bacterium]|nr:DUF1599 domain-containing protein [Phycisphaerales bacterium]